ncbi:MAG: YggT family protein [Armatimonadota bacterium]|nr:YggT family protein [Armatimonadota bacterium]MDR7435339.1 YggT family protein [Armatimonadota bacterium]
MELVDFVNFVFRVLFLLILLRVIMSWIPGLNPSHPVVSAVFRVTSPILDPIRRVLPPVAGLDLSPLVALLLLELVRNALIGLIHQIL